MFHVRCKGPNDDALFMLVIHHGRTFYCEENIFRSPSVHSWKDDDIRLFCFIAAIYAVEMPLVILATRRAQKDPEDVTAVPSATSVTRGAHMGHGDVTAVLLAIWSPRGHRWTPEIIPAMLMVT
jgi:hypothetical protein